MTFSNFPIIVSKKYFNKKCNRMNKVCLPFYNFRCQAGCQLKLFSLLNPRLRIRSFGRCVYSCSIEVILR